MSDTPEKCFRCGSDQISDWSYLTEGNPTTKTPHLYCRSCHAHHHKGTNYNAEEWFFYVNEKTFEEWKEEEDDRQQKLL